LSPHWIVARTQARREAWAGENIQRQGFDYYLPRYEEIIQNRPTGKIKVLFPRYIFVLTDGAWRFLLGTFGVVGLILRGESPDVMPQSIIDQFRKKEFRNGIIRLEPKSRFAKDQQIRLTHGHFMGSIGLYQEQSARHRVKVLLDILGGKISVDVHEDWVEAA
jgi:transcriptional antiterminator RfaH